MDFATSGRTGAMALATGSRPQSTELDVSAAPVALCHKKLAPGRSELHRVWVKRGEALVTEWYR